MLDRDMADDAEQYWVHVGGEMSEKIIAIVIFCLLVVIGTAGAEAQWFVTTDGSMRVRQDKVSACMVSELTETWGFIHPEYGALPGSVVVGHAVKAYYAGQWWTVKQYFVPKNQWYRCAGGYERLRPDVRETNKTKQRAYDWMVLKCK